MRSIDAVREAFFAVGFAALLTAGCGPAPTSSPQANNTPPPGYPPQGTPPRGGAPPGGAPPRGGVLAPAESAKAENDLKQICLAYHSCFDATGRPPSKPDDLYPFLDGPQTPPSQGLASGKYVFYWNVGIAQMTNGTSNTVLAYYKDTPTAGGPVVMADGVAKTMTPDEFKTATKAGK
jgi:hypothetical protein